jgi:hypothetical protein
MGYLQTCAIVAIAAGVAACGGGHDRDVDPPVAAPIAAAPAQGGAAGQARMAMSGAMPHGDHNPHHGGIVMMKGDLHFEVVSNPAGRYNLFFTDATRADLPAAAAENVSLTVHRTNEPDEPIAMHIDDAGESWEGTGRRVDDPADTTVRVAFTFKGDQPYWIDLPYAAPPPPAAAPPR